MKEVLVDEKYDEFIEQIFARLGETSNCFHALEGLAMGEREHLENFGKMRAAYSWGGDFGSQGADFGESSAFGSI